MSQLQTDMSTPVGGSANTPPSVTITSPTLGTTWKVDDTINFSASATDGQDGTLPPTAFDWTILVQHCPSNCHTHTYRNFTDTNADSFPAPDHEYPSYLELRVTATDSGGATTTVSRDVLPQTVDLTFASSPSGLQLSVGPSTSHDALPPDTDRRLDKFGQRSDSAGARRNHLRLLIVV